jgi:hypothetical protein
MAVCFNYDKITTLRVLIRVVKCCFALQHCPVDYLVLADPLNPLEILNEQRLHRKRYQSGRIWT